MAEGYENGPQGVRVEEALEWARSRLERVVVRYFAREGRPFDYSAGTRQPWTSAEPLPVWPPDDLDLRSRRMPGQEYLDRPDDAPLIEWTVGVDVFQGSGEPVPALPARLAEVLGHDPGLSKIDWVPGHGGGIDLDRLESRVIGWTRSTQSPGNVAFRARLNLPARTASAAQDAAVQAVQSALDRILDPFGIARRDDHLGWTVEAQAFPAGSTLAAINISLDDEDEQRGPEQR